MTTRHIKWKRIQKMIEIKKFDHADIDAFQTDIGCYPDMGVTLYEHHVTSTFVVGWSALMVMLDSTGVSKDAAPPILIKEIAALCYIVNPKLDIRLLRTPERLGVKRVMQKIEMYMHIDEEQLHKKGEALGLKGKALKRFMRFTEVAVFVYVDTRTGKVSNVKIV